MSSSSIWINAVICWKTFPCAIPPYKCAFHIGTFNINLKQEATLYDFEAILLKAIKKEGFPDLSKMRILNLQKIPDGYHEVLYVDISYQPDSKDTVRLNIEQVIKNWPTSLKWNLEDTFSQLVEMWIEFDKTLMSTDEKIDNYDWKLTLEEEESR